MTKQNIYLYANHQTYMYANIYYVKINYYYIFI